MQNAIKIKCATLSDNNAFLLPLNVPLCTTVMYNMDKFATISREDADVPANHILTATTPTHIVATRSSQTDAFLVHAQKIIIATAIPNASAHFAQNNTYRALTIQPNCVIQDLYPID